MNYNDFIAEMEREYRFIENIVLKCPRQKQYAWTLLELMEGYNSRWWFKMLHMKSFVGFWGEMFHDKTIWNAYFEYKDKVHDLGNTVINGFLGQEEEEEVKNGDGEQ